MRLTQKEDKYPIVAMGLFTLSMFFIAFLTNGTCDEGDSVMHFLFAKYAFSHSENYFNHWAKPFYVLVMSPFAHFGFMGVKTINTALSCVSVWFTYLIAKEMKYKWAIAVFVISLFFKTFMTVSFSGLTEPLSNVLIAIAIYLAFTDRYAMAAIIMSFLPFVRSEGLFLCGTFGLYLIWMRQWKILPLLISGHIVYGIAGYSHYNDYLWVIHKIPYQLNSTHYGHGNWPYYFIQMPMITGVLNCVLLSAGLFFTFCSTIYFLWTKQWGNISVKAVFLVIIFLVFFLMHTTFWTLGIFGSFGMIRVFIAIACVMTLIILSAIEYIDFYLAKWTKWHLAVTAFPLILLYVLLASNKSPYSYSKYDFSLHTDEIIDVETVKFIKHQYPEYKTYHLFFDACYFSELMDIDVFNPRNYSTNEQMPAGADYPSKSIVIWDDWYSDFEHNLHLETLKNNKSIREIKVFEKQAPNGRMRKVVLFLKEH